MKFTVRTLNLILLGFVCVSPLAAQDKDILPVPESYRVEGVPPIRTSEVSKLFYEQNEIRSNLIWDADKANRRLLVTDETRNIYLLDSPLAKPVKLTEKAVPHLVRFSPDGRSFLFISDHEKPDTFQLYLYDLKDRTEKKAALLTGKDESIESAVWGKTGDAVYYTKIDYESKTSKLCRSAALVETCFKAKLPGIWYLLDADEKHLLLKNWRSSSTQSLHVFEPETNTFSTIADKGNSPKGSLASGYVVYSSEGSDVCKGHACIAVYDLKKGRAAALNFPGTIAASHDFKISPGGGNLLVQETRDGIDHLRIFAFKNGSLGKEVLPFIKGSFVIWNTRWLSDRELVYTLENNEKPTYIQSFNLATGETANWTKGRLPAALDGTVGPAEVIRWNSFDNMEITGYIVRPRTTTGRLPVLIRVHGGPQVQDRPIFDPTDALLALQLGVSIIHTNIRGSSGFGRSFMDADDREKREHAVKDIRALLDWVEKQKDLDPRQIYLQGQSYGGFVVLSAAMHEPTRVKAVIAESPVVSIRGYLSQSWVNDFMKTEYGDPKDEALMAKLDTLSPLNNADRWNKIPLLMMMGKRDGRIPEANVVDLKNQLQKQNTEVWYIYSTEDGHGVGGKYVTATIYKFLKTQIEQTKRRKQNK